MKACVKCGQEFEDTTITCPDDNVALITLNNGDLPPGTMLGDRYEVKERIADGGMGKIYKAKLKLIDKTVAVKTLLPNSTISGAILKRFHQEAEAISKLSHPNILAISDFFVSEDGHPYLVTDYLQGRSVQNLIDEEGGIPEERAMKIFMQVASALKHAHLNGIVHRDLKPSNVMLIKQDDEEDYVKIIDFGIAKIITDEVKKTVLTETGDVFGSPPYMSPEQCSGKGLDARSDIYSLGCVLFAMLTGKPPFVCESDIEYMYKHVHDAPPAMPSFVSPKVQTTLRRMLAKDPVDRFQTIGEVIDALQEPLVPIEVKGVHKDALKQFTIVGGILAIILFGSFMTVFQFGKEAKTTESIKLASQEVTGEPKPVSALGGVTAAAGALGASAPPVIPAEPTVPAPNSSMTAPVAPVAPTQPVAPAIAMVPTAIPVGAPPAVRTTVTTQVVRRPVAIPQKIMTPVQMYNAWLAQGKKALNAQSYMEAQRDFKNAHNVAYQNFGPQDPRYIESMEWQGKLQAKLGNYSAAVQAFNYVIEIRKVRGDKAGVREAEEQLERAKSMLHKFNQ